MKKIDWLTVAAMIIMLIGAYLVLQEKKACSEPFKQFIDKRVDVNYSYARLTLYDEDAMPLETYEVYMKDDKLIKIERSAAQRTYAESQPKLNWSMVNISKY